MERKAFIQKYIKEIVHYFTHAENIIIVILDLQLNICMHNDYFKKLLRFKEDIVQRNIFDFLLPESKSLLSLAEKREVSSLSLHFYTSVSTAISLDCSLFRTMDKQLLLLGIQSMATEDAILRKMTTLSSEMLNITRELRKKNAQLERAQEQIKVLQGLLPICMYCKQIRDDKGYWSQLEVFITEHSEASFSHGICPNCFQKNFPEVELKKRKEHS